MLALLWSVIWSNTLTFLFIYFFIINLTCDQNMWVDHEAESRFFFFLYTNNIKLPYIKDTVQFW